MFSSNQSLTSVPKHQSPAVIYWGDRQVIVYNEAYVPLIGQKHPGLQGQDPRVGGFAEIWDQFEEIILEGEKTGQLHSGGNQLVLIFRHGYLEEGYFSWRFCPVIGPEGWVVASHATVFEVTRQVVEDRRGKLLHSVTNEISPATDLAGLCDNLYLGLKTFTEDLPIVVVYSESKIGDDSIYQLERSLGITKDHDYAPEHLKLSDDHIFAAALRRAHESLAPVVLRCADGTLPLKAFDGLNPRGFDAPCTEVVITPVVSDAHVQALVVYGLNPRKRLDTDYERFLQRLTENIIATKLSAIHFAEEIKRGVLEAEQADLEKIQLVRRLHDEMKFSKFAERVTIGLCITDIQGNVLYANKPWYNFAGLTPEDKQSINWMESVQPEDTHLLEEAWQKITVQHIPATFQFRAKKTFVESFSPTEAASVRHKIGQCFAYPDFDDEGALVSIMGIVIDISELKSVEDQLRMQTTVLTERMEEAILLRERQESFIDTISHEIRNPLSAVLHCAEDIVESIRHQSQEPTHLAMPPDNNFQAESNSISRNVVDAAQTILYCVEHQKRIVDDVLTLSKLDSDLLELLPIPMQPTETINHVMSIFDRELKASNILMLTKVDDSVYKRWFVLDPSRFLQVVINLITNAIKFTRGSRDKKITLQVSTSKDNPADSATDIEYFPARAADTSIRKDERYSNFVYLTVSVTDTGKGLTHDERKTLFNRFAQASPKTHIEYGGSGLGLFISRKITELMGGQIGLCRHQKDGCTFCFFVAAGLATDFEVTRRLSEPTTDGYTAPTESLTSPTVPVAAEKTIGPTEPEDGATCVYRVLVCEDNLINQKVLCKGLRKRGFLVQSSNHGLEALDALKLAAVQCKENRSDRYYDIVLCDIEMPVMDGIECIQEIRRLEITGALPGHLNVIAVTANVRGEHVRRAKDAGMDGFTTKPYRIDELIMQIRQFIGETASDDV